MIIHCNETYFKTQCELNGWPIDRAMKSVSQVRGDKWYVETNSPFYPGRRFRESVTSGPGTELKKLLKMIGITSNPNCSVILTRKMDVMGPASGLVREAWTPSSGGWRSRQRPKTAICAYGSPSGGASGYQRANKKASK